MNLIIISGTLNNTPELKVTNGQSLTNFYVNVLDIPTANTKRTSKSFTQFKVSAFDSIAEFTAKHLSKGSKVVVHGRAELLTYTDRFGKEVNQLHINSTYVESLEVKLED